MKKNLLVLLSLIFTVIANAQVQIPTDIKKQIGNPPKINGEIGMPVLDITLFEFPDFEGRSGYFKLVNGKLVAPFPTTHVSFKIPDGKIVYIKTSSAEFSDETVYVKSQKDVNLNSVTGIRSDTKSGVYIEFDGISTAIHNNDCKKVFGDIIVQIVEIAPGANGIQTLMPAGPIPDQPGRQVIRITKEFKPFSFANAASIPESYYRPYIYNNNTEPVFHYKDPGERYGLPAPADGYFIAGQNALREGRVKIVVTSKLGSAHKSCDLCDDFSSHIEMKTRVTDAMPLNIFIPGTRNVNTTGMKLVFGPYQALGSRDGTAITATAGTVKEFREYFKLKFYE